MKLEQLFTAEELALIDSGEYRPGRAVLDAKLDLCAAAEREACAAIAENVGTATEPDDFALDKCYEIETAIRARGNT